MSPILRNLTLKIKKDGGKEAKLSPMLWDLHLNEKFLEFQTQDGQHFKIIPLNQIRAFVIDDSDEEQKKYSTVANLTSGHKEKAIIMWIPLTCN